MKGWVRITMFNIDTLFLDVGGVILTNGWDRTMREESANVFDLDLDEMNRRHALTFDTYEIGKITLDTYLDRVVFYTQRSFSHEAFKNFMFAQSKPLQEMIDLISFLKKKFGLKVIAVSNEGLELMVHRIETFDLGKIIDFFVCSCFVGLRKPDNDIYKLALNVSQANPKQVIYIDDRKMFAEIGSQFGMHSIHHEKYQSTEAKLMEILK